MMAPENTLAAVNQAIAQHANFVGIDVQRTKDERLVVVHDGRLARTTDVEQVFPRRAPWTIEQFTLAEIRRLDAGSWMSPEYTNERIPTLARMLRELRASSTGAFLEIKRPQSYGGVDGIGDQVVRALRRHTNWLEADGPQDRVVVQAFDDVFLKAFEAKYDNIVVGTLGSAARSDDYAAWADQINVNSRDVNSTFVRDAHLRGLSVSTFVVNEEPEMRRVIGAGVDAISTDVPQRLHDLLVADDRVMRDPNAPTPPDRPVASGLTVHMPERPLITRRVPVSATIRGEDGHPARWTWVRVQKRTDQGWRTLQRRVTNRFGELRTTVTPRHRLRLRVQSEPTDWNAAAQPVVRRVNPRRVDTTLRLFGDERVVGAGSARLRVGWTAANGERVAGRVWLWARPRGGPWSRVRQVVVQGGSAAFSMRPRKSTRYRAQGVRGYWWAPDRDGHFVSYQRRR